MDQAGRKVSFFGFTHCWLMAAFKDGTAIRLENVDALNRNEVTGQSIAG